MSRATIRVARVRLANTRGSGTFKCDFKVVAQFVKIAVLGSEIAFDQVQSWWNSGPKFVHESSQAPTDEVALDGVADRAADRESGCELLGRVARLDVVDPNGTAAPLARGLCQPCELPTGTDPSRHSLRPSASGGPCHGGP